MCVVILVISRPDNLERSGFPAHGLYPFDVLVTWTNLHVNGFTLIVVDAVVATPCNADYLCIESKYE